jgi:hypothetical protein
MVGDPVKAAAGATGIRLAVRRLRIATGRVVADDSGSGVDGATVGLVIRLPKEAYEMIRKTLDDGRFAFDLSGDEFSDERLRLDLRISAEGFEDRDLTDLRIDDVAFEANLEVRLVRAVPQEPGRLRGRVLYDTGRPFAGGSMTLSFSREGKVGQVFRLETDERGEFLLEGIIPGEYELRSAPRRSVVLRETGRTLVIPPGGEATTEFTIPRGGDVEVTVTTDRGDPVTGAEVHVVDAEGEAVDAVAVVDGRATLFDALPGRLTLKVTAPGHREETIRVEVTRDQLTRAEVQLSEKR